MTNPLKTEHALDWSKTGQEIEDEFQAGMIERDELRAALLLLDKRVRSEHCACGNEGCRDVAEAWEAVDRALGRKVDA